MPHVLGLCDHCAADVTCYRQRVRVVEVSPPFKLVSGGYYLGSRGANCDFRLFHTCDGSLDEQRCGIPI